MSSGASGSTAQVQQTAHWTAVIATIAVSLCLTIGMLAMAAVVFHDGNNTLVLDAMGGIIQLGGGFAITLGTVVGGPQIVSVLVGRLGSGSVVGSSTSDASTPAPAVATVTIAASQPQSVSIAPSPAAGE